MTRFLSLILAFNYYKAIQFIYNIPNEMNHVIRWFYCTVVVG